MTPEGILQVKDTNLINLKVGDVLMYRAGDTLWPDWDILGALIAGLEGNKGTDRDPRIPGYSHGDYTHCAWVKHLPDPEAEVVELHDRPGIFKIKDGRTWDEVELRPGRWDEEPVVEVKRLRSKMGIRIHATWPCVKEESVDWENKHMEVWRIRRATPLIIGGIMKLADDMLGWQYDIADFMTFGNIHLPGARICSEYIEDPTYNASMLLSEEYPICLTPDVAGNGDKQKTPNDIINSGEMIKVVYQGLREVA
jgi:hypothetical protein